VRHDFFVLPARFIVVLHLGFANAPRVQPVISANGDSHEAERRESANGGQQHPAAWVTLPHGSASLPPFAGSPPRLTIPPVPFFSLLLPLPRPGKKSWSRGVCTGVIRTQDVELRGALRLKF